MHLSNLLNSLTITEHPYLSKSLRAGAPNSAKFRGGGVAEGQPRFDKGRVAIMFTFYALKISLF